MINLKACKELIKDLLNQLPKRFENAHDSNSALGAALQIAFKMMVRIQFDNLNEFIKLYINFRVHPEVE